MRCGARGEVRMEEDRRPGCCALVLAVAVALTAAPGAAVPGLGAVTAAAHETAGVAGAVAAPPRCGTPSRAIRQLLYPSPELPFVRGASGADCSGSVTNPSADYATDFVWVVPVVVHVIMDNACSQGAMSDANVEGQIQILNEDFRSLMGSNGAGGFDAGIHFVLADEDPGGLPTSGITRSCNTAWFNDAGAYKSNLAWDPHNYLNIYTNSAGGFLGYVEFLPSASGGSLVGTSADGVVVLHSAFGPDATASPYDLGRTTTHEVGHYLGLEHTFEGGCGDGASPPACYSSGDLLCDTAPESEPHYGCGASSTCGSPDPVDNYMNYTDDVCMTRFTEEQARRMRCSIQHWRPSLGSMEPVGGVVFSDGFESGDASGWN